MKVSPETVTAVNAVIKKHITFEVVYQDEYNQPDEMTYELDAEGVAALLHALAKCEPVKGVVDAAKDMESLIGGIDVLAGRASKPSPKLARLRATIAAIGGEA